MNWKQLQPDTWETAYQTNNKDILYIKDTARQPTPQTRLTDFQPDRYELRHRKPIHPKENGGDALIDTFQNYDQAIQQLEKTKNNYPNI